MNRLRHMLVELNIVDLTLRLSLIDLLLRPIGQPLIQPVFLALACLGLILPSLLRNITLWAALSCLTALRVIWDWPLADNHAYLLCYWCLAITLSLLVANKQPQQLNNCLALNARLLIGLTFLLAALWKLLLSPDYSDGTFFRIIMLLDQRFESFAQLAGGLNHDQFLALQQHVTHTKTLTSAPHEPSSYQHLAHYAALWNISLNLLIAVSFLWLSNKPQRWNPANIRNQLLLLFCFVTYAVANVDSFAWLILAMGVAQLYQERDVRKPWLLASYLTCYLAILLYRTTPWLGNYLLQP